MFIENKTLELYQYHIHQQVKIFLMKLHIHIPYSSCFMSQEYDKKFEFHSSSLKIIHIRIKSVYITQLHKRNKKYYYSEKKKYTQLMMTTLFHRAHSKRS